MSNKKTTSKFDIEELKQEIAKINSTLESLADILLYHHNLLDPLTIPFGEQILEEEAKLDRESLLEAGLEPKVKE